MIISRLRSRGKFDKTAVSTQQQRYSSCSQKDWTTVATQPLYGVGQEESMQDGVVPGFARRVAAGEVFFLPMSKTTTVAARKTGIGPTRHWGPYTCDGQTVYHGDRDFGNQVENLHSVAVRGTLGNGLVPIGPAILSNQEISNYLTELSTSVLNKRGREASNLWETLAESKQSMTVLQSIAKEMIKVVRIGGGLYARRKKLSPKSLLKGSVSLQRHAASAYLGYRYGLSPLIRDAVAVMKALEKNTGKVRISSRSSGTLFAESSRVVTYSSSTFVQQINERSVDQVIIRCMSLDEYMASMLTNVGFTQKGLLTLPWELLPYSFVVDWAVNVGDVIGSIVPVQGINQLGSCSTITRTRSFEIHAAGTTGVNGTLVEQASGSWSSYSITKTRAPGLTGGLVVRNDFRFDDITRTLDAFALLAQKLRNPF